MGYSVRYYGPKYGTLVCVPYTLGDNNTYISKFSMYFCDLDLPYDYDVRYNPGGNSHSRYGTGVLKGVSPRSGIRGGIWKSKPSTGLTEPDYYAKEEAFSVSGFPQASYNPYINGTNYPMPELSWYKKKTFTFDAVDGLKGGTTLYLGCYVPYTDTTKATTRCGIAYDYGEGYHNGSNQNPSPVVRSISGTGKYNKPYIDDISVATSYNPLSTYTLVSVYKKGTTSTYGEASDTFTATYTQSGGNKSLTSSNLTSNSKTLGLDKAKGSNKTKDFVPSSAFSMKSNKRYSIEMSGSDGTTNYNGGSKTINLYKEPETSVSTGSTFSPQDNKVISWSTASSSSDDIGEMSTTVKIGDNTVSTSNGSGSVTMTPAKCNSYFSASARSCAQLSFTLSVIQTNKDSGKSSSSSSSYKIQYKPTQKPSIISCSNSGQTILIDDYPTTSLSWNYPSTAGAAGWVNGYRLRVYSDSACTELYKTIDVSSTSSYTSCSSSGSYTLSNASDLRRGKMNYVTITPYYVYPSGGTKLEGTQSLKVTLVKPVYRLSTPVIDYPKNETTWHNKYFRILFRLPEDKDKSYIDTDYGTNDSAYKYEDIEVSITANGSTYKYTSSSNSSCFSSGTWSYKKYMALNPSLLSNFPNTSSYTISIRCKKKYYGLSESQSWSKSVSIAVNNTAVNRQSFTIGQEIKASHYTYVRDASVRLNKCYPFKSLDSRNVAQGVGDQIDASEYLGIYITLQDIQNGINGYCTYDRSNVKLTHILTDFTNNPPKVEYITASDSSSNVELPDGSKGIGRNYMNMLVDDMNLLY